MSKPSCQSKVVISSWCCMAKNIEQLIRTVVPRGGESVCSTFLMNGMKMSALMDVRTLVFLINRSREDNRDLSLASKLQ